MRSDSPLFNAISRETIYRNVMTASESEEWAFDWQKFKEFDIPARQMAFKLEHPAAKAKKSLHPYSQGLPPRFIEKDAAGHYIITPAYDERTDSGKTLLKKTQVTPHSCQWPHGKGYIFVSGERIDFE